MKKKFTQGQMPDSPLLNTINSIVIFSYLYFNIWITAPGYPSNGTLGKKEMIIPSLNVSFNTILSTDIYVALEQELCLPSRSEYIRLIAIILDPPKMWLWLFGHCPNSFCTPAPHSTGHSGALHLRKKCPKPSGQGLRPPPPYGQCPNARAWIWVGLP